MLADSALKDNVVLVRKYARANGMSLHHSMLVGIFTILIYARANSLRPTSRPKF